ncbi:MAG TPA: bifunctional phosphoribosyl-AMP cyclohydrolase/phosphoribosyl-ATP diphosphatase HisIE [Chitinophagaceae bacterium]|nr:bifunctional phosphoribosyl-AMP cyclohydrolase/phosphoribosyl-ATP diphosphatase HisIE [Chitinophagaceae bacterium]
MKPDFLKYADGLIPAIVQDAKTQKVLMLGFMNEAAYNKTMSEKIVSFYSRSRQCIWTKGETSGNYLNVKEVLIDCDNDTLLIKANPVGPVCHTGSDTCFKESNNYFNLKKLEDIISERKNNPSASSYTSSLFEAGINKIAQKVGEEAVELVIESKDNEKEKFLGEAADLLFHYLVLLNAKETNLDEVIMVLANRHK